MNTPQNAPETVAKSPADKEPGQPPPPVAKGQEIQEINGPKGPEPTRFGDWERKGRCIDF
jgi:hypothetical protein